MDPEAQVHQPTLVFEWGTHSKWYTVHTFWKVSKITKIKSKSSFTSNDWDKQNVTSGIFIQYNNKKQYMAWWYKSLSEYKINTINKYKYKRRLQY